MELDGGIYDVMYVCMCAGRETTSLLVFDVGDDVYKGGPDILPTFVCELFWLSPVCYYLGIEAAYAPFVCFPGRRKSRDNWSSGSELRRIKWIGLIFTGCLCFRGKLRYIEFARLEHHAKGAMGHSW